MHPCEVFEMPQRVKNLFRDEEHAKTTIAVGGTALAAIGFIVVLVAVFLLR